MNKYEEKRKADMKALLEKLDNGVRGVMNSEQYQNYLKFLSKFHDYSYNNALLIMMQKPDASLCAGYKSWQKYGRQVKRGEKGIRIIAPVMRKVKVEENEKMEEAKETKETGKEDLEETEQKVVMIPKYQIVSVFDVSQTEGEALPIYEVNELKGNVEHYEDMISYLVELSPVTVDFRNIEGGAKGYYDYGKKQICVQKNMSEVQTVKTLIHEISHCLMHDVTTEKPEDLEFEKKTRNSKEVEAESVAYIVSNYFGIDTSDYSFGYICSWSSGKELKELKESLYRIQKCASYMITEVEANMSEIIVQTNGLQGMGM